MSDDNQMIACHDSPIFESFRPDGTASLKIKLACHDLMNAYGVHPMSLDFTPIIMTTNGDDKFGLVVTRLNDLPLSLNAVTMLTKMDFEPPSDDHDLGENVISLESRTGRVTGGEETELPFHEAIVLFDSPQELYDHLQEQLHLAPKPRSPGR